MKASDLPEFTQMLTSVCVLNDKPMSEALIELYWRALEPFAFDVVKAAFHAHISNPDTGQFMPKPADVVRYMGGGGSHTQALRAWSKVTDAIRCIGVYPSVIFDDPLIHAVIEEMGGWVSLCQILMKDVPFRANEFEKRYAGYVVHPPERYPSQLTGLVEADNRSKGYEKHIKPPLLFGDKARALAVLHTGREKLPITHLLPAHQPVETLSDASNPLFETDSTAQRYAKTADKT